MKLIETIKNKLRFFKKYSDKESVTSMYLARMERKLNLDNPKCFTEKLQWLKLNYRTPEHTICADKYEVRDYLTKKVIKF